MREDLQKKLCEDFPTLLRDHGGDPKDTCMAWGIAIGVGWYELFYKLCEDLMHLPDAENIKFEQIKEKFGTLRIYHSGGGKAANDLIDRAEAESAEVCENCGSREEVELRGPGWLKTICGMCARGDTSDLSPATSNPRPKNF